MRTHPRDGRMLLMFLGHPRLRRYSQTGLFSAAVTACCVNLLTLLSRDPADTANVPSPRHFAAITNVSPANTFVSDMLRPATYSVQINVLYSFHQSFPGIVYIFLLHPCQAVDQRTPKGPSGILCVLDTCALKPFKSGDYHRF